MNELFCYTWWQLYSCHRSVMWSYFYWCVLHLANFVIKSLIFFHSLSVICSGDFLYFNILSSFAESFIWQLLSRGISTKMSAKDYDQFDHIFKVLIIGDSSVGKSALVDRLVLFVNSSDLKHRIKLKKHADSYCMDHVLENMCKKIRHELP